MKRMEISGLLKISTVSRSLNKIFLSWNSIVHHNTDMNNIFPENIKSFENYKIYIYSFENKKKLIVDAKFNNFQEGKIIIKNWKQLMEAYDKKFGKAEAFLIFQMEKEGLSYNYILYDASDLADGLKRLATTAMAQKSGIYRKSCGEYEGAFVLDPHKYILEKEEATNISWIDLGVKEIRCVDNCFSVIVSDKNNVYLSDLNRVSYVLMNEETGEVNCLYADYDISKKEIIFGNALNTALRNDYMQNRKMNKICIYPFYEEKEGKYVYFELKNEQLLDESLVDNKKRHFISYAKLIRDNNEQPLAIMAYYSENNILHFMLKEYYQVFSAQCNAKLKSIKFVEDNIRIEFRLDKTEFQLKEVSLILRSKVQNKIYPFALNIKDKGKYLDVVGELSIEKIEWEQFYWDIRGIVIKDGEEFELRLKNHSIIKRLQMLLGYSQRVLGEGKYVIFPYLTKSKDFAIMYRMRSEQDNVAFVLKEYLALFLFYILYPYWKSKHLWLVYEKYSITAQDNSYYFFKYCMEKLTTKENKNIFYVIDKKAPDYQYVEQYGKKIIQFLSLKHMIYLKAADLLVSSDTKAHSYAWHSPNSIYRELIKYKKNAFLQHGVIYYKQCHQGLKKNGTNACKLFIVSSEVEKQIIKQYFGYKEDEIAVTGLARWDVLEDKSVPNEKMILMMPTWRNWLEEVTEEEFRCSDYFKNYSQLLNNKCLHTFLEQQNVKLIFYIHPKFREYIGAFSTASNYVEFVEFGSQPLNALIMKCNMMVTDYSSACWDVYYQSKPVLFYLFDYELYSEVQGSYVDMRTEAFGEATDNMDTLVELMKIYAENGFKEKACYAEMRDRLLPYRDELNSERTYQNLKKKFSDSK